MFRRGIENQLTFVERDPVTGEIKDRINAKFLKFNKQPITRKYNENILRIKSILGLHINEEIPITTLEALDNRVVRIITDILNIDNTKQALVEISYNGY